MDSDRTKNSGWYPDPYELAELRYFDGLTWTDFVMSDGVPAQVATLDAQGTFRGRPVEADPDPATGFHGERAARPPSDAMGDPGPSLADDRKAQPVTCAAGPCNRRRVDGRSFCGKHGPQPAYRTGNPSTTQAGFPSPQPKLVCPHCRTRGSVSTAVVKVKGGISRSRVRGALLTGGLSLLATGLTRKHRMTRAGCSNCGMTWRLA